MRDLALAPRHLADVMPNDPNPCAPRLHPLNDPLPLQNWVPYVALGVAVLTLAILSREKGR